MLGALKYVRALPHHQLECVSDMRNVERIDTPMLAPLHDEALFRSVYLEPGAPARKDGHGLRKDAFWKQPPPAPCSSP